MDIYPNCSIKSLTFLLLHNFLEKEITLGTHETHESLAEIRMLSFERSRPCSAIIYRKEILWIDLIKIYLTVIVERGKRGQQIF